MAHGSQIPIGPRIPAPAAAIMAEAAADQAEDVSAALDRVMREAAALVLRGYELPTDVQIIISGGHYRDDRGEQMWNTVKKLVAKREELSA